MTRAWLSASLVTTFLIGGCASAASHIHSFESPQWSGRAAVPPGATLWISSKGTSLGASSLPAKFYSHDSGDLTASLRLLLKAQQRLAANSFLVAADSLVLRIAAQVPAAQVRRVLKASVDAGFRSLWLVVRNREDQETAVRLLTKRKRDAPATHRDLERRTGRRTEGFRSFGLAGKARRGGMTRHVDEEQRSQRGRRAGKPTRSLPVRCSSLSLGEQACHGRPAQRPEELANQR